MLLHVSTVHLPSPSARAAHTRTQTSHFSFTVFNTLQEDDPLRAVRAAVSVRSGVEGLADGVKCFVGVTTGMAFCGVIGSERRRECEPHPCFARACVPLYKQMMVRS